MQAARPKERFWAVVLVSALGETLDRASVAAARKVFVDGFMTTTFVLLAISVVVNIMVDTHIRHDRNEEALRLEKISRWAFPAAYAVSTAILTAFFFAVSSN